MVKLYGTVCRGRGKAKHRIEHIQSALENLTGGPIFAGTLNVTLQQPIELKPENAILYLAKNKMFWRAKLCGWNILIYRYKNCPLHVMELVADCHLRAKLNLNDGDQVALDITRSDIRNLSRARLAVWRILWHGKQEDYYLNERYTRIIYGFAKLLVKISSQKFQS